MISKLWQYIVHYIASFLRGELHFCSYCGALRQCFPFGESVGDHWRAMSAEHAKHLGESIYLEREVPEPFASMRLCIDCNYEIGQQLDTHRYCCRPILDEIKQSDLKKRYSVNELGEIEELP